MVAKDVDPCPRCAGKHEDLKFKPLQKPVGQFNYFASCPTSKEPLLATVTIVLEHEAAADSPPPT